METGDRTKKNDRIMKQRTDRTKQSHIFATNERKNEIESKENETAKKGRITENKEKAKERKKVKRMPGTMKQRTESETNKEKKIPTQTNRKNNIENKEIKQPKRERRK